MNTGAKIQTAFGKPTWKRAGGPAGNSEAPRNCSRISKRNWQSERATILLRLCRCIDKRVQRGQSVSKAARKLSRKWNQRPYRRDPRRAIRLSASSLAALYSKWRKNHRSPEIFRLGYFAPTARRIPTEYILEVARRSTSPGVFSLQTVLRGIRAEWEAGKKIPGLGTWKQFARRKGLKVQGRKLPIALPFSRTVYRHFSGIDCQLRKMLTGKIAQASAALSALDREILRKAKEAGVRP